MIKQEHELKTLILAEDFHLLKKFLSVFMVRTDLQTNYYYDTREEIMRMANTTIRVRQKGNRLNGTIKRHLADGCSIEEHFHVDMLPRVMMIDSIPVWLKGSLTTERTIYKFCDGIEMMLDLNKYLGVVDYELEIEFREDLRKQAEWLLSSIKTLLQNDVKDTVACKSERFFQRLKE